MTYSMVVVGSNSSLNWTSCSSVSRRFTSERAFVGRMSWTTYSIILLVRLQQRPKSIIAVSTSYSCRKTRRSSSFDTTDKLEMGRYELGSSLSRSGFLSSGVMNADLNTSGTIADENERLKSSVRNGLLLFFQWTGFVFMLTIVVMCNLSTASLWLHDQ